MLSASSPADQAELAVGLDALRFAGLEPVVYPSATDSGSLRSYLAGDDQLRACDLRAALADPAIAGIVFACGGYGAQRTLAALDWASLAGRRAEGAGRLLRRDRDPGGVRGPARLGQPAQPDGHVLAGTPRTTRSGRCCARSCARSDAVLIRFRGSVPLAGGIARGLTLGGNLTLLSSSVGTDTSLPARGGILLVEDEDEDAYRVDRMLTQLRRCGYLDGVAGIIGGTFTGCGEPALIEEILAERLGDLGVPLLAWANIGHGGH